VPARGASAQEVPTQEPPTQEVPAWEALKPPINADRWRPLNEVPYKQKNMSTI
jgi:hypothetical protein